LAVKIGNIVRDLRKRDGISQTKLAKILFCAAPRVSFLESGHNEPRLSTLLQLSDIFNVSLAYLIGREQEQSKVTPTRTFIAAREAGVEIKGLIVPRKRGKAVEEEE